MNKKIIVLLLLVLPLTRLKAQFLQDEVGMALVKTGIDHIYNFDFAEADRVAAEVNKRYPGHPVTYLLKAFSMNWRYLPIDSNKEKMAEYQRLLQKCLEATRQRYGNESDNPEAVFFTMASHGYIALTYNYRGEFLKAVGEARKAYKALVDGMGFVEQNPDFYFTSGLYNYYVNVYPQEYPIVKPLMIFFKSGNKAKGLQQLRAGAEKGLITMAETCYYLSHIYMAYEDKMAESLVYTGKLRRNYPENPVYRMRYIENLLHLGRNTEAENENKVFAKYDRGLYRKAWHLFNGLILERKKDDTAAKAAFEKALAVPLELQYVKEYHAMSYAGLARIAHRAGDKKKAKALYKKCLEYAEYKRVIAEAKNYKE
ncbi:hypothetical protein GCM10023091_23910 [Ravibacter arvi]|uniref:Tetratricopeptide repeat protein n=1 Tax=Ravibacter arvi TaxID=2051041 RepID=A0ABP8LYF1_9BACT